MLLLRRPSPPFESTRSAARFPPRWKMSAASGFYSNFTNPDSRLLFESDGFVLLSVPSGTDKCSNGGGRMEAVIPRGGGGMPVMWVLNSAVY